MNFDYFYQLRFGKVRKHHRDIILQINQEILERPVSDE